MNSNYSRYRIINQAKQILNYSSNVYFDKNNLIDVVRIFNNILIGKSGDFTKSLNDTIHILEKEGNQREFIYNLENNNNSSFVIIPMFSLNHAFYGVLRKINNEYSLTIVNRGSRGSYNQYEEFVIDSNKLEEFIDFLKGVERQNSKIQTNDIYIGFAGVSKLHYSIDVISSPQKVGNCFIKELEAAIKYAFATRNETNINLVKLRETTNVKFNPKWNLKNSEIHYRYIKRLEMENMDILDILEDIYNIYYINKNIQKMTKDFELSIGLLEKIFYKSEDVVGDFLRNIDMQNFGKLINQIENIVNNHTTQEVREEYLTLKRMYSNLKDRYTYSWYEQCEFKNIEKDFTNIANQLKEEYINMYYNEALKLYSTLDYDESIRLLDKVIELSPDYAYAYRLRALVNWDNYDKTDVISDIDRAIEIQPFEVSNYVHKAKFLNLLDKFDEYVNTCRKLLELDPNNKDVCVNVYKECYIRGKFNQALEWITKARSIDKKDLVLVNMENTVKQKIRTKDRSIFG